MDLLSTQKTAVDLFSAMNTVMGFFFLPEDRCGPSFRHENSCGPILESLVYRADIVTLQETNRRHLGVVILVRDSIITTEMDMSRWDNDEMQL